MGSSSSAPGMAVSILVRPVVRAVEIELHLSGKQAAFVRRNPTAATKNALWLTDRHCLGDEVHIELGLGEIDHPWRRPQSLAIVTRPGTPYVTP